MVDEKGLDENIADKIGEFVKLRGKYRYYFWLHSILVFNISMILLYHTNMSQKFAPCEISINISINIKLY